ncbi:hypothetical protein [Paraglaciecola mesophila]|uniref:hypothetical protein n=1 Tax=Paraglaciecola mesophila TaxID=197222 RepID=UPI00129B3DF5|nr:hypothetical protein [Paraglaciecola mesophila]
MCALLWGCAGEPYGSLEVNRGHNGYREQLIANKEYFLRYAGTTRHSYEDIEVFWERRASELCPLGYESLERKREKSNDTIRVPISGTYVNVAAPKPRVVGRIKCVDDQKQVTKRTVLGFR